MADLSIKGFVLANNNKKKNLCSIYYNTNENIFKTITYQIKLTTELITLLALNPDNFEDGDSFQLEFITQLVGTDTKDIAYTKIKDKIKSKVGVIQYADDGKT